MTEMSNDVKTQGWMYISFYAFFGIASISLMVYYLSDTLIHFTTSQQFPISSFKRFPLTFIIFPAEVFSFLFSIYFVYNLINGNYRNSKPHPLPGRQMKKVAILIPVFNEPREIVSRTLSACRSLIWPGGIKIYLLDDSTNEKDIRNMQGLSKKFGCTLVRRKNNIGFKAGNINNAIGTIVKEEFFVILDSDQAPEPEFLEETMDYFSDSKIGFVQVPQHFVNNGTPIERAAKLGTNIFYHSQCLSKAKDLALPFCGTNVVLRTGAFRQVGGFSYYTSTEDIDLGLRMNEAGYYGAYVPKMLVHGYAPTDFKAYSSQQYRWSNGNLAILRESWIRILFGKFSLRQQIHIFATLGWWFIGIVTLLYISVPMLSFFFGGTHHTWLPTALLMLLFLNVALGILMIFASLHNRTDEEKINLSDALLQYSLITNSMFIYVRAAVNALFKRYAKFERTNKRKSESSLWLIKWNILLSAVCFGFSVFALFNSAIASDVNEVRTYLPISIWLLFYSVILGSSILFVDSRVAVNAVELPETSSATRISRLAAAGGAT